MSITLIWTLLNQGFEGTGPNSAVQKAMVVCPTSLVGKKYLFSFFNILNFIL